MALPAATAEVSELLKSTLGGTVEIRGAGTKRAWGGALDKADLILATGALTGVVEHAAGDLIVVVRAGTPMAQLQEQLAARGQQLALDQPYPEASVGGTVAANVSGPRRMLYGTARDLVIGTTVVLADGTVAHSGGKVVKNVAGYDLGKLFTGSYGTLGLITELAFRLHPLAPASAYVTARPGDIGAALAAVRRAQVVPSAVEVDWPAGELAVLVEGTATGVAARAGTLAKLLGGQESERPAWWGAYPWEPGGIGLKLTAALSRVPALLTGPLRVRGSAGTGVLYAALPPGTGPDEAGRIVGELRETARDAGGHAVVLTAPSEVRDRIDLWGPVDGLALMWRVKQQFDPDGVFAAGRFAGGI
jgi:glycolate oxidase FAD binding subunit